MVKKAAHALVVGAGAIYVSEAVMESDSFKKLTDENTKKLYKYGGAAIGAMVAGYAWHALGGGSA